MEVTYGLLSNLVKTRSILRVLAPIASQISLLIILNESEDEDCQQSSDMVPCSQTVMQATNKLCMVAKQQAHMATDKEFVAQTMSSCEVLELASSNLYIAAERMQISKNHRDVKDKLVQACKDVLQGTMKVLLVADDAEIRRLVTTTHIVTEKLSMLQGVRSMPDLVTHFKEFTDALGVLTGLADKRQRDLIHSRQRERILSSMNTLKQCVSSLSTAMQNAVKYSSNAQAQMGKSFVVNEVLEAVRDIVESVQNTNTDETGLDHDGPGNFVTRIDQALEALSGPQREDLHLDLEMWTEEVVRHSMTVAHVCLDSHRDLIIRTCQRVIQVKGRVVQMYRSGGLRQDEAVPQFREDYDEVCELLVDEFCELEKHVNVALLHLVVEYFKETTQPLERLVKKAVYTNQGRAMDHGDECITEFESHAEKACQIAMLAAASSTDARRVHVIQTSVQRLESLDPELTAAVVSLSRDRGDRPATAHLKLLMREWTLEMTGLLQVLDEMTDPKMFLLVSERKVEDDINTCNGCLLISDRDSFVQLLQSVIGRSRRVVQVTERIVDSSDDAVFRNGLMVFLQQLKKAITAVRAAGGNLAEDFGNKGLQATLRRRFSFLQESLMKVKLGLNEGNHPDILSPLRRNARVGAPRDTSTDYRSKVTTPRSLPGRHMKGDQLVATSVPRLQLVAQEDAIVPQSDKPRHAEMRKSASTPGIVPVTPQTYAWKLIRDLVSWATKGEKEKVNLLCGDMLGWTNHIVDVATSVLAHCKDVEKKREVEGLCFEVDGMVPQLLEKVKYVLHGDFSELTLVKQRADEWATKVEKVRVFVDVTVDRWKCVCDKLCAAARRQNMDLAKHELETVEGHQKAVSDLTTIVEKLRWESKVRGQHEIEKLLEDRNDLDNLTVTLKTTTEMITDQGLKEDLVQLETLGREWSVQVHCAVVTMETVAGEMLGQGGELGLWPCLDEENRGSSSGGGEDMVENLQEETAKMKDLVKCACFGCEDDKEMYKGLVMEMRGCVEELRNAAIRRKISAQGVAGRVAAQYSSLCIALHKAVWILKAMQCVDLARRQSSAYSRYIDLLIDKAFHVKAHTGVERLAKLQDYHVELDQFTLNVKSVRKKVLSCIQLSAELDKRSVVRQALDEVNSHAPEVPKVLVKLAETSDKRQHGDVTWCRLQWCARVRHLVVALRQISDIKAASVTGIKAILVPETDCPDFDTLSARLQASCTTSDQDKLTVNGTHSAHGSPQTTTSGSPSLPTTVTSTPKPGTDIKQPSPGSGSALKNQSKLGNISSIHSPTKFGNVFQGAMIDMSVLEDENEVSFEPVVVNLKGLEEQIIMKARRPEEESAPTGHPVTTTEAPPPVSQSASKSLSATPTSRVPPTSAPSSAVAALLRDAQYLQREACRWQDEENPVVKVARTMATQTQHMTQYIKYDGPITSHLELVQTAKAVADNSEKILKFARTLSNLCVDEVCCENLQAYCSQIPLVRNQLAILAQVQLGTAGSETADRMLVQNTHNLMRKILNTMTACEAVCIKGLKPDVPPGAESAVVLAARWRQKHLQHRYLGLADTNFDELGLRIVEDDAPPPALRQMFTA